MGHLTSKGAYPAPPEYIELILCRNIYHCLPSELDQEDGGTIALHLEMLSIEAQAQSVK